MSGKQIKKMREKKKQKEQNQEIIKTALQETPRDRM